jgi:hypothetical protein
MTLDIAKLRKLLESDPTRQMSMTLNYAELESLVATCELAIAHDQQPYPTAEAYEKACAALKDWRERAAKYEKALREIEDVEDCWHKSAGRAKEVARKALRSS